MRQQGRAPEAQTPAAKQPERDPVERFKEAQREFIGVAGRFDLDPKAKARAGELREEMKTAALEITKDPARMREAEREESRPRSETSSVRPSGSADARRARVSTATKGLSGDEDQLLSLQ